MRMTFAVKQKGKRMRYIDADALKKELTLPKESKEMGELLTIIIHQTIDEQPTADVRPNVRGEWIKLRMRGRGVQCSICGNTLDMRGVNAGRGDANFCPNCGSYNGGDTE